MVNYFSFEELEEMNNEELREIQESAELIFNKFNYDYYNNPTLIGYSNAVDEAINPIECHNAYIRYVYHLQVIAIQVFTDNKILSINDLAKLVK